MSLKNFVGHYSNGVKKQYSDDEKLKLIQLELEKFTDSFWEQELEKANNFVLMNNNSCEANSYVSLKLQKLILKRDTYLEILKQPVLINLKLSELKEKLKNLSTKMSKLDVDFVDYEQIGL